MSKYNLTDILEQYKIGSGWTTDFDYDGMLKTGLGTSIDTPIEVLKKMSDDFEDVNYHRENSHLQYVIDAIEIGDMMEAEGRLSDFHAEIKQTMGDLGMDISDDLGAYMASKMDLDEDAMNNVMNVDKVASPDAKAHDYGAEIKGISDEDDTEEAYAHQTVLPLEEDKDKEPRDGVKSAAAKLGMKPSHIKKEVMGVDRKGNKKPDTDGSDATKFKKAAMDVKEEKFSGEDEMQMHLKQYREGNIDGDDLFQAFDEIINGGIKPPGERGFNTKYGMEEADAVNFNMKADADYDEGLEDIEEALPKFKGVPPMRDIVKALKNDAKATDSEIKQFMASVKKAGDEFDDVDDYVEDFKNYVADKSLQEHFKRFM